MKQRDTSIDFLRCLGLLLIMLAHVNPPEPLFEFRTFDLAIVRGFPPIQDWKYPPTFYYLAYGIVVSLLLCRLLEWQPAKRLGTFRSVAWLSRNSFWLYFWHMIPVLLLSYEVISIPSWPLRYLVVLAAAVLLTGAHNRIKSRLFARRESISPSH